MENASKALIIAGGMLLAMMLLAMIVYVGSSMGDMAESQDRKIATEQLKEFNETYLAYNKTRMYGTDVITVVNKTVDYNKRLGTDEEEYKINIVLNLKNNFDRTKQIVTEYGDGRIEEGSSQVLLEGSLKTGTYQLFEREGSMKMNDNIIQFFNQKSDDKITNTYGTTKQTTFTYSGITNFKTAIFECESVGYSEKTGRINSMTFKQI